MAHSNSLRIYSDTSDVYNIELTIILDNYKANFKNRLQSTSYILTDLLALVQRCNKVYEGMYGQVHIKPYELNKEAITKLAEQILCVMKTSIKDNPQN